MGLRDGDAFARRQRRILDDQRIGLRLEIAQRRAHFGKTLVGCGGNAVPRHKRLGEAFGALEPRRVPVRPEDTPSRRLEHVDDASNQRHFGADDGKIYTFARGKSQERLRVLSGT